MALSPPRHFLPLPPPQALQPGSANLPLLHPSLVAWEDPAILTLAPVSVRQYQASALANQVELGGAQLCFSTQSAELVLLHPTLQAPALPVAVSQNYISVRPSLGWPTLGWETLEV